MKDCRIKMTIDEQKLVMLKMLVGLDTYCNEYNLRYFLDAGTLLGAVRHHGYIPWDDDVDVNMPRADLDRLVEIVYNNGGYFAPHIKIELPYEHLHPYCKILDDRTVLVEYPEKYPMQSGVYIDLFAKDVVQDSSLNSKWLCKRSEILGLIQWFNKFSIYAWKKDNNMVKRAIAAVGRQLIKDPNLPVRMQDRLIHRNAKKHPVETCKYVTTLTNGEFHKIAPKECFDDYIMMDFEKYKFRCPVGYDTYLRCLYPGDYMQLPPEDKRVHHNTIVYWKSPEDKDDFYKEHNL